MVCGKARKRLYFLRKLNEFQIDNSLQRLFFDSVIFSVLTYGLICWFGNLPDYLIHDIERIMKTATRIIRDGRDTSMTIKVEYRKRIINMTQRIVENENHPLRANYVVLRSGQRLRAAKCRTNRLRHSYIPRSIAEVNEGCTEERMNIINSLGLNI
jgi:hypothetical protein